MKIKMTETTKGKKIKAQIVERQRNFTSVNGFSLLAKTRRYIITEKSAHNNLLSIASHQ
jgi:hypothetical protein